MLRNGSSLARGETNLFHKTKPCNPKEASEITLSSLFENLQGKLQRAFKALRGHAVLTEEKSPKKIFR